MAKLRAKTSVNIRSAPKVSNTNPDNRLGVLYPGAIVTPTGQESNGFLQVTLENAWVSKQYLENVITVPNPNPPNPQPIKQIKLGLHFGAGNDKTAGAELYKRQAERGRPFSFALVLFDLGIVQKIKAYSPSTLVGLRVNVTSPDNNPLRFNEVTQKWYKAYTGAEWFGTFGSVATPQLDFIQIDNEMKLNSSCDVAYAELFNEYNCELMTAATNAGCKVSVGNIAPGHLEGYHLPALQPMFTQCEREQHYFDYHAYTDQMNDESFITNSQYYSLRWKNWVRNFPRLKVINGEVGVFNSPRRRSLAVNKRLWGEYHNQVAGEDQLIGGGYWSDSPTPDWEEDRINLADFEQWCITTFG